MRNIKYNGSVYKVGMKEDEKYAGGLWDLAEEVSSSIYTLTDLTNYDHYEEIQELIYNFIKYDIFGADQSAME